MKYPVRIFYLLLGLLATALGGLGVMLPLIPTVPFLMLALFCFVRSSEKLHKWLCTTKMYKIYGEPYFNGKGISVRGKVKIMIVMTLVMGIGFIMMDKVPIARVVLAIVWTGHLIFVLFKMKTQKAEWTGEEG